MTETDAAPASNPPPSARAETTTTTNPLLRRAFPQVVFLVLWTDGQTTLVKGAFAGLLDANAEARVLGADAGVTFAALSPEDLDDDFKAVSWRTAEGVGCWVEAHAVAPKKIARRGGAGGAGGAATEGKLYENEEGDDEISDDADGNYD